MADYKQCQQRIYVRDVLRYTGRGPGGFQMRFEHRQCQRIAKADGDYCWQHRERRSERPAADAPAP